MAAAPQPYLPQGTGTLSDVIERGPEFTPFTPAGPDGFKPAPSFGEMFSAAKPEALRATPGYDDAKIGEGYRPIIEALGLPESENPAYFGDLGDAGTARFGSAGDMTSELATRAQIGSVVPFTRYRRADRALQEVLVAQQIRARRAKDPGFLPGVPDDVEGLRRYFEQQQAKKRAEGAAVLARGSAFGRTAARLSAGFVESATHDPTFLPTLVIGGGTAGSLVQAAGRDALINGVLAAAQLPTEIHNMAENDEHLTAGGAAGQVLGAAALGGLFGGSVHLTVTHVPPALFRIMPESVQARWASRMRVGEGANAPLLSDVVADMDNRELASFARSTLGKKMTADEKAAAETLERNQDVGGASPFMAGPAGDAAHNASLADALKSIIDGAPRQTTPGSLRAGSALGVPGVPTLSGGVGGRPSVPADIVAFFKSKGLDDAHAYGIAAGISAEARGGDHNALNPTSGAFGLGQWLGSRKAALVERYGRNPTREQQLEFLWSELSGGDAGGKFVLEAKDAGSVLDAYIRRFMRPAAGAETIGDLKRGMAALGRGGELPEGAAAAGLDDDALAALRSQASDADAEAQVEFYRSQGLEISAQEELALRRSAGGPQADDMPVLRRELFASDADWAEAQVQFYRSQGLVPDVAEAGGNGARRAETDLTGTGQREAAGGAEIASEGPAGVPDGSAASDVDKRLRAVAARSGFDLDELRANYNAWAQRDGEAEALRLLDRKERELGLSAAPLSREELEETGFKLTGDTPDALWYAGLNNVTTREMGREPQPLWAVLDKRTGEIVTWSVKKKAARADLAKQGEPGAHELLELTPDMITGALRRRAQDMAAAADVTIDDPALTAFERPGGEGVRDVVDSLDHDYRLAAEDPALAARAYQIDDGEPRTLLDILAELDSDRAAAAALRACAGVTP